MAAVNRYSLYVLLVLALTGYGNLYAQSYLPPGHPDYVKAKEVFDRVWAAFGNHSSPPRLEIRTSVGGTVSIAKYEPGVVLLDAGLVPHLSETFKEEFPAALACVIGHELAHHHHRHTGTVSFAEKGKILFQEQQADISGFFYAYLAGYPSFAMAERLFNSLYEHYRLNENGSDAYPPKSERIRLARSQVEEVQLKARVYEAGKALMLAGKTRMAIACLLTVDTYLPAIEVKNNLGLCFLMEAIDMNLITREEMPFLLPLELEMSPRLLTHARLTEETKEEQRKAEERKKELLTTAEKAFQQALLIGSNQGVALNLAITYLLMNNPQAAVGTISRYDLTGNEAVLVRGIARLKARNRWLAAFDFKQLEKASGALFETNRQIYEEVLSKGWDKAEPTYTSPKAAFRVLERERLPDISELVPVSLVSDDPFPIYLNRFGFGQVYKLSFTPVRRGRLPDNWTVAHVSLKGSQNKRNVQIGDPEERLTGQDGYGFPNRILKDAVGRSYYHYRTAQIVFILDEEKVAGWYIYDQTR